MFINDHNAALMLRWKKYKIKRIRKKEECLRLPISGNAA